MTQKQEREKKACTQSSFVCLGLDSVFGECTFAHKPTCFIFNVKPTKRKQKTKQRTLHTDHKWANENRKENEKERDRLRTTLRLVHSFLLSLSYLTPTTDINI